MTGFSFSRRRLALVAAALLVSTALPAFADDAPLAEFHIGFQKNGPLVLARKQGLIEKALESRGIKVSWVEFTSGPPLLEALGAGAIDFGPTGDIPPIFAQAAGRDLLYVGATPPAGAGSAILVKTDSPIHSLEDLRGKTVGYKYGSSSNNFIVQALKKAGIGIDEIKRSDLSPADGAAAFRSGAIDAWVIWDPFYAIAEKDPDTRVLVDGSELAAFPSYYLANGAFTKAHPELIREVVGILDQATQWADQHKPETAAALSEVTGVPLDVQTVAVNRTTFGRLQPLSDEIVRIQQSSADTFYELKLIPKKIDVRAIVWTPPAS